MALAPSAFNHDALQFAVTDIPTLSGIPAPARFYVAFSKKGAQQPCLHLFSKVSAVLNYSSFL